MFTSAPNQDGFRGAYPSINFLFVIASFQSIQDLCWVDKVQHDDVILKIQKR